MRAKAFLDTNIFVYCFDISQLVKKERAEEMIRQALWKKDGVISYQVAQEFLNLALKKFSTPLKPEDCREYLHRVLIPMCKVYPDNQLFESALDIVQSTGYAFYDALILAAAQRAQANILYSEELQHGQIVGGVKIVNPFL
jgi:predicted nucleic acid-binding protein